ncbi:MAG: LEA type 2 family protein [Treponema sp.]|jgi:LEA14-like dessication related protein|nr:LEA type 2 family protein [Treponema sp.]
MQKCSKTLRPLPLVLPLFLLMLSACKTPQPAAPPPPVAPVPPQEKTPVAALEFDRVEAERPDLITLYYHLKAENPRSGPLDIEIRGWKLSLNGEETPAALTVDGAAISGARFSAGSLAGIDKTLILEINLQAPAEEAGPADADGFLANLSIDLAYRYGEAAPLSGAVSAEAAFPRIREPEFTITSIAIMQAELINTRFRVSLRIDNPNLFPLSLSSFDYELYGEGRFWANGKKRDMLQIPAQGSAETNLFLVMNFIDMKRHLLDEIIAMRMVRYRFTGEAEVGTGVSWLPQFHMGFDHSGSSVVLK